MLGEYYQPNTGSIGRGGKTMEEQWGEKQRAVLFLFFTIVLTLLIQLPLLNAWPFVTDENLYAMMIANQQDHGLTTALDLFGYRTVWKPPLFFWTYATLIHYFPKDSFIPLETIYRLPGILFACINLCLLLLILRGIVREERIRYLTLLVYALVPLNAYVNNSVLTETLTMTFMLAGLYCYMQKRHQPSGFLLGGVCTILAFFTKLLLAGLLPLLAIAYMVTSDRKNLRHPVFLLSLLALPVAVGMHYVMVGDPILFLRLYQTDIFSQVTNNFDPLGTARNANVAVAIVFPLVGLWAVLALAGVYRNGKENPFFAFWLLLAVVAVLAANMRPWYFFSFMPPMAYFASLALAQRGRNGFEVDKFSLFGLLLFLLASLLLAQVVYWALAHGYSDDKAVGEFLAGKENVLYLGDYRIGTVAYSVLNQLRINGSYQDFGWVVLHPKDDRNNRRLLEQFMRDYHTKDIAVNEENINEIYWEYTIFRKKTNITRFDYAVIGGNYTDLERFGEIIYRREDLAVVKLAH